MIQESTYPIQVDYADVVGADIAHKIKFTDANGDPILSLVGWGFTAEILAYSGEQILLFQDGGAGASWSQSAGELTLTIPATVSVDLDPATYRWQLTADIPGVGLTSAIAGRWEFRKIW